jgi:yecA family protein
MNGDFDQTTFPELAAFLGSASAPTAMSWETLDGYFLAIALPEMPVPLEAWMASVWGEHAPVFASMPETWTIREQLGYLHDNVVERLEAGTYRPTSALQTAGAAGMRRWCRGFRIGMDHDPVAWDEARRDPRANWCITAILGFANDDPERAMLVGALPAIVEELVTAHKHARVAQRRRTLQQARGTVHRLTIALADVEPAVWRTLEVPSTTKLAKLGLELLAAMGWNDSHLHDFAVGERRYGMPDPEFGFACRDERTFTLAEMVPTAGSTFVFRYDFGDNWRHVVTVDAIEPVAAVGKPPALPRCIAGANACPPDDCGGVRGYDELIAVLADPSDHRYADLRRWAPRNFDPHRFDLAAVNRRLRPFRPKRAKRVG